MAIDFHFDQTADGHNRKLLHVVDEFTLGGVVDRAPPAIDSDHPVKVIDSLVAQRENAGVHPPYNGPELTANAVAGLVSLLTRRQCVHRSGVAVAEPLRRELRLPDPTSCSASLFSCLAKARVLIED